MSTQPRQTMNQVARSYPPDTNVLEQGLRRAFPVEVNSCFEELITAIDMADEEARKERSA
jgi:hypothetical protein